MSRLIQSLQDLTSVEGALQDASRLKKDLERRAWAASGRTVSRARQLIAEATLSLLAEKTAIDATSLEQAVKRIALKSDQFAVDLSEDWIEAALGRRSD
ncbi:hypothetical protein [Devosia elaeis]|uniref:Uncharacterized protein n=1 Tax=Devosia elaeis TaxID=1770058 RepID=A0A178HLJ3_9HYPH|nr:hypothetical protein [Devosia elaeis]OAM73722.1 hypothetical protein A3840_17135 [Devosia elaeis]